MKSVFHKTAVILLLFMVVLLSGFSAKKNIVVEISTDNGVAVIRAKENDASKTFWERIFGVKYTDKIQKLKDEGKNSREILDELYMGLTNNVDLLCESEKKSAINATAHFYPNRSEKFSYDDAVPGREIDKEKLLSDIVNKLGTKSIKVLANYRTILPEISKSDLIANTVRRGSFKTYYGYSSAARKDNIERAVSHINGTVVKRGTAFSFNGVVGARTAERGYKEAPIIIDGKFEGGIGGGVCQVSTTLYNAVLYADLNVLTVSRHSLPVKYVLPSFDAMVSSASDFRFCNDTKYDAYIEGKCEGGYVTFTIYGAPREYEIKLISEKIKDISFSTEYISDDTLDEGIETVVREGSDGFVSEGYLVRIKNGIEISNTRIRRDVYAPVAKTILRGTRRSSEITDNN